MEQQTFVDQVEETISEQERLERIQELKEVRHLIDRAILDLQRKRADRAYHIVEEAAEDLDELHCVFEEWYMNDLEFE